jgi:hypothetical protein
MLYFRKIDVIYWKGKIHIFLLIEVKIPLGNCSVYTLNIQLSRKMQVSYNIAPHSLNYTNHYHIMSMIYNKLLVLNDTTEITTTGATLGCMNMVNYQKIILRCPALVFLVLFNG